MTGSILWTIGLLLFSGSASPQGPQPDAQQSRSATYSETVRRLKDWSEHRHDDADDQRFGWLFADGDLKQGDLAEACADADEDVRVKAVELLQVTGGPELENCLAHIRHESSSYLIGWASALRDDDFVRFEKLFAPRVCEKAKECEGEQLPEVFASFVYALILDGSDRAQALLRRVYALRAVGMEVSFVPETLDEALSLVSVARQASDQLGSQPNVESVVAAAFYISPEHRKSAAVRFLGRSSDGNRMLLRVSYHCGMLCGQGYAVVLERHGDGWSYALITMEWIR